MSRVNPPPDDDPFEAELRRAMHAHWDAEPLPADLGAAVRARAQRAAAQRRTLNAVGLVVGLLGLVFLMLIFSQAIGGRGPLPLDEVTATPAPAPPTPDPNAVFFTPHPILSDRRVRQAIAYCTDRAQLIQSVYPWLADPRALEMDSFVLRAHWAYPAEADALTMYPFDPERGRALLAEAGWTPSPSADAVYRANANGDELALILTTTDAALRQTWAAVFENQMLACGLRIVRFHAPSAWFFGASTGLGRRDFELAAFAWANASEPPGPAMYGCDFIPSPANAWQGSNYMGWCNRTADAALHTATNTLNRAERQAAYRTAQAEFMRDLPSLPLFLRAQVYAINSRLENFAPDAGGLYTWNAAQWKAPGKDEIVIGLRSEPASLFALENSFASQLLQALIAGRDVIEHDGDYQPGLLAQLPTVENGGVRVAAVEAQAGMSVVDASGHIVELKAGALIREAEGNVSRFSGVGTVSMQARVVTFTFVPGLAWSDGAPVTKADYELGYKIICNPATIQAAMIPPTTPCDRIASVKFLSDAAYEVTWKPGDQDPGYFLPPFTRLPAHHVLSDGRQLADLPPAEWPGLPELREAPLGVGPYRVARWEYGQAIGLEANLHYYAGAPATPRIIARIYEDPQADLTQELIAGRIDMLGADAINTQNADEMSALLAAEVAGRVRVIVMPSTLWEHLDFALFVR